MSSFAAVIERGRGGGKTGQRFARRAKRAKGDSFMTAKKFLIPLLSAAALIAMSACRTSSTKTATTSSTTTSTYSVPSSASSTSYGTTSVASTDNSGNTYVDANGQTVTKTTTTTTIYKNGQAV